MSIDTFVTPSVQADVYVQASAWPGTKLLQSAGLEDCNIKYSGARGVASQATLERARRQPSLEEDWVMSQTDVPFYSVNAEGVLYSEPFAWQEHYVRKRGTPMTQHV